MVQAYLSYRQNIMEFTDLNFRFINMKSSKDFNRVYGQLLVLELSKVANLIKRREAICHEAHEGIQKQVQERTEDIKQNEQVIKGIKRKNLLWFFNKGIRQEIDNINSDNAELQCQNNIALNGIARWKLGKQYDVAMLVRDYRDVLEQLGFQSTSGLVKEIFCAEDVPSSGVEVFLSSGADRDLLEKVQIIKEHLESQIEQSVTNIKHSYGIFEEEPGYVGLDIKLYALIWIV